MPESTQVHIDAALTNLSVAYRNNDYIANALAPMVPVRKQSDRYYVYDSAREQQRATGDLRAPGGLANEVDFALSNDRYFCDDHALASAIPDEERENADPAIQPDIDRTEFLTDRILLNQEIALESRLRTDASIAQTAVPTGEEWNDPTSDPVEHIMAACAAVFTQCQKTANVLVLPYSAYEALRVHPAVIDRIRFSSVGVVTTQLLAQIFDVEQVLVPRCVMNTAAPGQTAVMSPLWGNTAYAMHITRRPGLKQLSLAYNFVWNAMPGSTNGTVVERWRDHGRKADMIRVQKYYDLKLIAPAAAHRMTSLLA